MGEACVRDYVLAVLAFGLMHRMHGWLLARACPSRFACDRKARWFGAECCNAFVHSSVVTLLCGSGLCRSWARHGWFTYDGPNAPELELALVIMLGYFTIDLMSMNANWILNGARFPAVWNLHHGACAVYLVACLALGIGAETAAVGAFMAEITNPVQSAWTLAKAAGRSDVHAALTPVFAYSFTVMRCVVSPVWSADVVWFCLFTDNKFGRWGWLFAFLCIAVNVGGFAWTYQLWRAIRKRRTFLTDNM